MVLGRGWRQRQVGVDFAKKEPGAGLFAQQQRVLADPAEPGLFPERFFQHRRAVGEGSIAPRRLSVDLPRQPPQPPPNRLVVIPTAGILGNVGTAVIGRQVGGGGWWGAKIVHACRNDAHGGRLQRGGNETLAEIALEVSHLAMKALRQPAAKLRCIGRKIDIGKAHFGEAEFMRPSLDLRGEPFYVHARSRPILLCTIQIDVPPCRGSATHGRCL